MKKETWKNIKDYEGYYQISSYGRVKSLKRQVKTKNGFRIIKEKILKLKKDKDGYLGVILSKNSNTRTYKVHRLVAEYFLKNYNNLPQVNHIDGNKQNNYYENLEYVANLKNTNHYHSRNGTKKYGVHMANNKWRARIKKDGKSICLGHYEKKDDAYQAFYNKYKELHGVTPW